jgi:hypothetical protein
MRYSTKDGDFSRNAAQSPRGEDRNAQDHPTQSVSNTSTGRIITDVYRLFGTTLPQSNFDTEDLLHVARYNTLVSEYRHQLNTEFYNYTMNNQPVDQLYSEIDPPHAEIQYIRTNNFRIALREAFFSIIEQTHQDYAIHHNPNRVMAIIERAIASRGEIPERSAAAPNSTESTDIPGVVRNSAESTDISAFVNVQAGSVRNISHFSHPVNMNDGFDDSNASHLEIATSSSCCCNIM